MRSRRGGDEVGVLSSVPFSRPRARAVFPSSPLSGTVPTAAAAAEPRRAFTVALNVFGFFAVAALSGYLAEGLRRAGEQLEETSTQLADLQAFSQHVIDSLTSGLATCDMEGRLLTFNHAAEAITGVTGHEAIGAAACEALQLPGMLAEMVGYSTPPPPVPRLSTGSRAATAVGSSWA